MTKSQLIYWLIKEQGFTREELENQSEQKVRELFHKHCKNWLI